MVFSIPIVAGAAVAGAYNWVSSIYTYNRDAWMTDLQLDQQRTYQEANLLVSMKDMDREEIRDLMMADIGKIGNVILVTTLILSLAGEMLFEAAIPDDCPAFVLNAYMLCLGSAVLHLVLSILFGMYASNEAYATSTQMLTGVIRPRWEAYFNTMQERRSQEATRAFDQKPLSQLFMPPLASRVKKALAGAQVVPQGSPHASDGHMERGALESEGTAEPVLPSGPNDGYREAWKQMGQAEWQEFKKFSFRCAAYGTKNLLEACGYLCIARLFAMNRDAWAFWAIQAIFISLNVIMMQFLLSTRTMLKSLVVGTGALSCAVAATTSLPIVDRICVPLCYASHVLVTLFLVQNPIGHGQEDDDEFDQSAGRAATEETTYFFRGGGDCCVCVERAEEDPEEARGAPPTPAQLPGGGPRGQEPLLRQVSPGTRDRKSVV